MAPNVFFRQRPTKLPAAEAAARIADALGGRVEATVHGDDVVLSWRDGPAAATVGDAVAPIVNWEVRGRSQPPERPGPGVLVARTFSPEALAVAVVRYRGSSVRPYDSSDPAAVAKLSGLLEIDDPARSGYPVVDAMAALLLAADEPALDVADDASPADRLAAKLSALGYDALWNRAWSTVT
jgi:hypothetical protein